jgi:hypothetical protein
MEKQVETCNCQPKFYGLQVFSHQVHFHEEIHNEQDANHRH